MFRKLLNFLTPNNSNLNYLPRSTLSNIDWTNPKAKISKFFTVHEATYLPSWDKYHTPTKAEKVNILHLANILDCLRELYGPIIVHCWIRPEEYNSHIGGSSSSAHITGQGVDFHFKAYAGETGCNYMRKLLCVILEKYKIRLEDRVGNWLHLDTKPVTYKRFFKP